MGFEELPHTADCALRAWAPDLAALFVEAARGLNFLAGAEIGGAGRVLRKISLHDSDIEGLLVAFLSELVYCQEHDRMGYDQFELQVSGNELSGVLRGCELLSVAKPIKAVTFHNLKIQKTARGQEVEIVFDV